MSKATRAPPEQNQVNNSSPNNAVAAEEGHSDDEEVNDFESAIEACTYGRFHIMLLVLCQPIMASAIFETTTMAYVYPAAECDLNLSLMAKGVVNAMTYVGMIISAIPWGFIADTTGRKNTLISGLLFDGVCVMGAAVSQNVTQLLIFKFFGGFASCGPFAIIVSYLSEFHSRKHRSRVMMATGMIKNFNTMLLPAMALVILPFRFEFTFLGLKLYNWNLFIAITGLTSLVSGFILFFLPESPKFLMSQGRNAEALQVFQRVYAINTGQDKQQYPVKHLFDEAPEKSAKQNVANRQNDASATATATTGRHSKTLKEKRKIAVQSFGDGLKQLKPLFSSPYLRLSLIVYSLHFALLMGQNTIRLWLPQIFASMEEYEHKRLGASSMCNILEYNVNKTHIVTRDSTNDGQQCFVHITPASYVNNTIAAASALTGSIVASLLVNKVGNKRILCFSLAMSFIMGSSFYFSTSSTTTLIISSLFVTFSGVSITTVITSSVNIFPTAMRTMVVILVMTFGRLGTIIGNLLFPIFITMGCIPPFIMIGCCMLMAFSLSLFLPETNKIALK